MIQGRAVGGGSLGWDKCSFSNPSNYGKLSFGWDHSHHRGTGAEGNMISSSVGSARIVLHEGGEATLCPLKKRGLRDGKRCRGRGGEDFRLG